VVGGAISALQAAVQQSAAAKKVYIIYRGEELRGDPVWLEKVGRNKKIEVLYKTRVVEILGNGEKVTGVRLRSKDSSGTKISPQVQGHSVPFFKDARKDSSTLVENNTKSSLGENLGKQLPSKNNISTKFSTPFKRAHSHPRTLHSHFIESSKEISLSETSNISNNNRTMEQLSNGKLKLDKLFIEIGGVPGTALIIPLGVRMDKGGYVHVDDKLETSVSGVFAAGDLVHYGLSIEQIATAVGLGARAAASAFAYIKNQKAPTAWGKAQIKRN
jgi:thioredoxin reductase